MTHAELLNRIDTEELTYWLAFHQLNPIDPIRGDIHTALLASVFANSWGGKTKPTDFLINWDVESNKATRQANFQAWLLSRGSTAK